MRGRGRSGREDEAVPIRGRAGLSYLSCSPVHQLKLERGTAFEDGQPPAPSSFDSVCYAGASAYMLEYCEPLATTDGGSPPSFSSSRTQGLGGGAKGLSTGWCLWQGLRRHRKVHACHGQRSTNLVHFFTGFWVDVTSRSSCSLDLTGTSAGTCGRKGARERCTQQSWACLQPFKFIFSLSFPSSPSVSHLKSCSWRDLVRVPRRCSWAMPASCQAV